MGEFFEFFLTQSLIIKQNFVINHKGYCGKWNYFNNFFDLVIIIWMFELFTIVLVFFLNIFNVINPNLIGLIYAKPFIHHRHEVNVNNLMGWVVCDLIKKNWSESLFRWCREKISQINHSKRVIAHWYA